MLLLVLTNCTNVRFPSDSAGSRPLEQRERERGVKKTLFILLL